MNKKALDLTKGYIPSQIIQFTMPIFLGIVFTELYGITNSMLVGNFVSKEALSAVSASTWICNIFNFTFYGLGMGSGILVARYYGSKDNEMLTKALSTSIIFSVVGGVILTILSELALPLMMKVCNIKADIYQDAHNYLSVYLLGNSAVMTYQMASFVIRSLGDSKHPLYYSIISAIVNLILGIIFVRFLDMKVVGTALATIISQFLIDILCLRLLFKVDGMKFDLQHLNFSFDMVGKICALGIPTGIQNMLIAVSSLMIQSYINLFPNETISGIGVAEKVANWAQLPSVAIGSAITAFVAQNKGANKYDRIKEAVLYCVKIGTIVTALLSIVVAIFAPGLVSLFNKDATIIAVGTADIRYMIFCFIFLNLSHVFNGAYRGLGDVKGPTTVAIMGQVIVKYLFVFIGLKIVFDVRILYLGTGIGYAAAGIFATIYYLIKKF